MKQSAQEIKPEDIIEIVVRRRWFVIIPFCLSMIAGIYLAITLPKIYEASTLILIQPQEVSKDYVQSAVSSDIDSRYSTISQQILSRTSLEKIIKEFKLFSETKYENMFIEDKIETMQGRIAVELMRQDQDSRRPADSFSITYKGRDPENVMRITNTLASNFINENLRLRAAQAAGTSDFLGEELDAMRINLEKLEENIKYFREKFMLELPEQLQINLKMFNRAQDQLSKTQQSLMDEKNKLLTLENYMIVEQNLQELKTKYTDQHPDVIKLKKMISDFKKNPDLSEANGVPTTEDMRQRYKTRLNIKAIEKNIAELTSQVNLYQKRVENTPKREQELLSLKRDYDNANTRYNSILSRKFEAEIAVNLEKKQKGEQFRVIDAARLPQKPVEPNMKKLFMLVFVAILGLVPGLVFLMEYLDTSFTKPDEIESLLGIPVVVTLPVVYYQKDILKQKLSQFLSTFIITISFVLFIGFIVLTFKGVDQTIEFIGRFINV